MVPGELERYLDDMIPGYRDNSNRAENDLGSQQSQSGAKTNNIKREPADSDEQSENERFLETDDHPDISNVLAENEALKKQDKFQSAIIDQQTQMIEKLKDEMRLKKNEFKAQRKQWERRLQEEQSTMINNLKDAKSKKWCCECQEMIGENTTETCNLCALFQ